MNMTPVIGANTYELVSLADDRILYKGEVKVLSGTTNYRPTFEISHLTSKAGSARSMVKVSCAILPPDESVTPYTISSHLVVSHYPDRPLDAELLKKSLMILLAYLSEGDPTVNNGTTIACLTNGTFVPAAFTDPIADPLP